MNETPAADRRVQRGLAKAIARSWRDEEFAQRLAADPRAALLELGVEVPDGVAIQVVPEGTVVLPLSAPGEITDEAVEAAALQAYQAFHSGTS